MQTENEKKNGEIDFLSAKEIIIKEISEIPEIKNREIQLPEIFPEKNEIKVSFPVGSLSKEIIFDCLQVIKNYIENIRVHTFEQGYYCFQALNDNLFENKSIIDNIKFRFIALKNQFRVEISKKGDLKRDEIYTVISLFKFLNTNSLQKSQNPKEILNKLGISVFDPADSEKTGDLLTFEHIAGYPGVKQEILESIVMPINSPGSFDEVTKMTRKFPGINRPRAVLFEGDPGVGKTTMAKVVSCLCNVPLIYVPIESILSKYYGESSQNLAYVFDAAALFPSALIFLDEIDALAGSRDDGMIEATRKVLSVLLRKLDGFEGKPKTITIGATNRKQDLDRALLSRFDRSIFFPLPNQQERASILGQYACQLSDSERNEIALKLNGYSGRNLKDFCDSVERKWVSGLIEKNQAIKAPSFDTYRESAELLFQK